MKNVLDIYAAYDIPSWLGLHQLRVAAVAVMIADRIERLDRALVIETGLFHDMGNILKFDLSDSGRLAAVLPLEQLEHWREIRREYEAKYGTDEHHASIVIGREIGLREQVLMMIDNMRFSRTRWVLEEAPFEMKIVKYADLRVGPLGILPLRERLDEANARYRGAHFDAGDGYDAEVLHFTEKACAELEMLLLKKSGLESTALNDETAQPVIEQLRTYSI